jgi:hypothetical protein
MKSRATPCSFIALVALGCAFGFLARQAGGAELRVADFGAKGDGTNDDSAAIEKAMAAMAAAPRPVVLRFEPGRNYRAVAGTGYVMHLQSLDRARVEGAGATLLLGGDRRALLIEHCRDVTVRGLRVDYDPLPFAEALVTGVDKAACSIDVRVEDGFALPPAGGPTKTGGEQAYFAMLWQAGPPALRSTHYWLADLAPIPGPARRMRVVAEKNFRAWDFIQPGVTRITLPVRGVAHRFSGGAVITVDGNRDVLMEDMEVWSAPWMACVIQRNEGSVTLRRVNVRPRPGSTRITSSWRDGMHVKGNRAALLFEDCVLDGMNDDAFNIATFVSRVEAVTDARVRVRQIFPLGHVPWRAGDTLAAYATNRAALLERARVLEVQERPSSRAGHAPQVTLTLERPVQELAPGDIVWAVEAANPGATLRRCVIRNSCRFQSGVTLERCDVAAFLWFYGEHIEGPLPSGSVVRQCRLRTGRGNADLAAACNGWFNGLPAPATKSGSQPLAGIQFLDNEIDGRLEIRHARAVVLRNNRFSTTHGSVSLRDGRAVLLEGNRLGDAPLPAARIHYSDPATREAVTVR